MSLINRLSMPWKILLPVILLVTVIVAITVFALNGLYTAMLNERILATRHIAQSAASIINHFVAKEERGEITREEAEKAAKEAVSAMRFDGENYIFAFDPDGVNKIHIKESVIGKNLMQAKDKGGMQFVKLLIDAANNGGGSVRYFWPKGNDDIQYDKYGWGEPVKKWGWMVGTGVYVDDIDREFWSQAKVQIVIGVSGALIALVFAFMIFRNIAPPIKRLTENMGSLANGSTDVLVIDTNRSDEIGRIAKAVQVFIENEFQRKKLIQDQAQVQEEALMRSDALRDECAAFDREIITIMDSVKSSVGALASSTVELTGMADSTLNESKSVMSEADIASTNVETVASAAEQLSASVAEIRQQVLMSTKIAAKAASEGKQTNEKMRQLADAASKIGEVVSLINDIAEQTNLLALNATIEAARAGDAGRGFSVVAAEVKELSTQTTKATEEISDQIAAIQNETLQASHVIGSVTKTVVEMNDITNSIASAVEQQGLAVEEIARNVLSASEGTRNVSESMGSVSASANGTRDNAERVKHIASQIEVATDASVDKIHAFLNKVKNFG